MKSGTIPWREEKYLKIVKKKSLKISKGGNQNP
jgi:hypothetical protein